jgi:hypothetical protein
MPGRGGRPAWPGQPGAMALDAREWASGARGCVRVELLALVKALTAQRAALQVTRGRRAPTQQAGSTGHSLTPRCHWWLQVQVEGTLCATQECLRGGGAVATTVGELVRRAGEQQRALLACARAKSALQRLAIDDRLIGRGERGSYGGAIKVAQEAWPIAAGAAAALGVTPVDSDQRQREGATRLQVGGAPGQQQQPQQQLAPILSRFALRLELLEAGRLDEALALALRLPPPLAWAGAAIGATAAAGRGGAVPVTAGGGEEVRGGRGGVWGDVPEVAAAAAAARLTPQQQRPPIEGAGRGTGSMWSRGSREGPNQTALQELSSSASESDSEDERSRRTLFV